MLKLIVSPVDVTGAKGVQVPHLAGHHRADVGQIRSVGNIKIWNSALYFFTHPPHAAIYSKRHGPDSDTRSVIPSASNSLIMALTQYCWFDDV